MRAEVQRRLVHISGAGMPATYVLGVLTYEQLGYGLLLGSGVVLVLEALRLSGAVDWWIYDRLTREYEQEGFAGYALYFFSMTLVAFLFPPQAAVPGMFALALGDPVSGLVGSGELRDVKGSVPLLAMFGVSTAVCLPFVALIPAVLGGAAATLADGVKPVVAGYVIDDNLTIPPAVAVAITVGLAVA